MGIPYFQNTPIMRHGQNVVCVCMYVYIYRLRVKAGRSPELPGTLCLVMYYKRRYGIEMGGPPLPQLCSVPFQLPQQLSSMPQLKPPLPQLRPPLLSTVASWVRSPSWLPPSPLLSPPPPPPLSKLCSRGPHKVFCVFCLASFLPLRW